MSDSVVVDYSPEWPVLFADNAARLRQNLGPLAMRIDHIGSTSIPGLAAKPIIDIQISIRDFEPMAELAAALEGAGFVWKPDNPEISKRYFRERPGAPRTHIHVRRLGSWHEQWALLFRDYMRSHPEEHSAYAELKRVLAERYRNDRQAYTQAKDDHFWSIIRRADRWVAAIGWRPGSTDA